jgi:glycosyltransferase involved in cell wall biosynthesis
VARSICFYTDSLVLGGAEESLFTLISTLDRAAWRPLLVLDEAAAGGELARRAVALEIPLRFVSAMPLGAAGARRIPAFVGWLRRERPAVFHAQLTWPLGAKWALASAVLARVPAVVAMVQLAGPFELTRPSEVQLRLLARGVGRYLAVSRGVAAYLTDRLGLPGEKVEVVYNAVRGELFDEPPAPELREQLTGGWKGPVVLTCARLDEQKGHRTLLAAAGRLPEALFLLAGDGPERQALARQARGLGVAERVRFLGHRSDVGALLAACDVFALPSLYEGSSLALLEAMAAGKAIVASEVPGTDELIDDGQTGVLVAPGDPAALATAIRGLLADERLRADLGERAQRAARRFTPQTMATRVAGVYRQLLGEADAHA